MLEMVTDQIKKLFLHLESDFLSIVSSSCPPTFPSFSSQPALSSRLPVWSLLKVSFFNCHSCLLGVRPWDPLITPDSRGSVGDALLSLNWPNPKDLLVKHHHCSADLLQHLLLHLTFGSVKGYTLHKRLQH